MGKSERRNQTGKMHNKKIRSAVIIATVLFSVMASARIFSANPSLPAGVVKLNITPPKGPVAAMDSDFPSTAAAVFGNYLWLGRNGGFRKYDRNTLSWTFVPYDRKICFGAGTNSVVPDPPYLWFRLSSSGTMCRYDMKSNTFWTFKDPGVILHSGIGNAFFPGSEYYYVAGQGGPETTGVSLIEKSTGSWFKLFPSKSISAMYVDSRFLWLGVPEGILRINRVTEDYTYYQPNDHGGGGIIKNIIPIPSGLAFATLGNRTGILGDKLIITKRNIQVYMNDRKKWFIYSKLERDKMIKDLQKGIITVKYIATKPGLLILKNEGGWKLLNSADGIAADDIYDVSKDDKYLYLSTLKGISVLNLRTLAPVDINRQIFTSLRAVRKIIPDDKYIWVIASSGLFRVEKKYLFSAPPDR